MQWVMEPDDHINDRTTVLMTDPPKNNNEISILMKSANVHAGGKDNDYIGMLLCCMH